jgi:hypothetical protein
MDRMARKVKLPESQMAFGLDKIDDFDLTVDNYSQGRESLRSEDVSDFEDDVKAAPHWVYVGEG